MRSPNKKTSTFYPSIFARSYFDSKREPVLAGCCENFHFDADTMKMLDDKFALQKLRESHLS